MYKNERIFCMSAVENDVILEKIQRPKIDTSETHDGTIYMYKHYFILK